MAPPNRYPNPDERRAAVRKALKEHGHLTMEHRRALAAQFSCTTAVIGNDIVKIRKEQASTQAPAVLGIRSRLSSTNERETAILRLLGRVEMATSEQLKSLIFPDMSSETMRTRLHHLLDQGAIWQTTTSMKCIDPHKARSTRRQPPPKAPYVFGLTHEGKALLETLDVESYAPSYALLKSRDRRAPLPSQTQFTHDLMASEWCCSVIDGVRRCPTLVDIQCHVEYVSGYSEENKQMQRFDAYVALRFALKPRKQTTPGWWLPWYDDEEKDADHKTVRFALEVDRGTEKLVILMTKGFMYRELTLKGHYTQTLGGPVLPVLLVEDEKRASNIVVEWRHAWPNGAGVISTPKRVAHPYYGALWGEYFTMADKPVKPTHLLSPLIPSIETWATMTRNWVPGTPQG